MIDGPGFDKNFAVLESLMTLSANKQKVIANNISNVSTPGFRRKELVFEEALQDAVANNEVENLRSLEGFVKESNDPTTRNDGNNVNIDKEMGLQNRNALAYSLYTELYAKKVEILKLAMRTT
ncbi:MAG: flagellar basal body rod protein FlgB [Planctomycetota bacterium]|jgi:flagellar basal-body rod protein FlgB|nr:flagellar basal body rod protein FlgB [Planctomycetota bacterium]MDP7247971.1 flagellar basal body rod protein FlgB [Planctomycetota bacterium]